MLSILERATSGVLAVEGDEGYPYAVPMSFLYEEGKLYFHSAGSMERSSIQSRPADFRISCSKPARLPGAYFSDRRRMAPRASAPFRRKRR